MPSTDHQPDTGISFGGALRWYCDRKFAREMGLSLKSFRKLCRALSVPLIEVGSEKFVCLPMFKIAMWTVSRIGRPDFLVPGCATIRAGNRPRCATRELDPEDVKRDFQDIITELIAARRLEGLKTEQETVDVAREAAERLVASAVHLQPQYAYDEFKDEAAKKADREVEEKDPLEDE